MRLPYYNFHKEHKEEQKDIFVSELHKVDDKGKIIFNEKITDVKLQQEQIKGEAETNVLFNGLIIGLIGYMISK